MHSRCPEKAVRTPHARYSVDGSRRRSLCGATAPREGGSHRRSRGWATSEEVAHPPPPRRRKSRLTRHRLQLPPRPLPRTRSGRHASAGHEGPPSALGRRDLFWFCAEPFSRSPCTSSAPTLSAAPASSSAPTATAPRRLNVLEHPRLARPDVTVRGGRGAADWTPAGEGMAVPSAEQSLLRTTAWPSRRMRLRRPYGKHWGSGTAGRPSPTRQPWPNCSPTWLGTSSPARSTHRFVPRASTSTGPCAPPYRSR